MCPECYSISSDQDSNCGVCNFSLSQSPSLSIEDAEKLHPVAITPQRKRNWNGISCLLAAAGLFIAGILSGPQVGAPAVFILILGFFMLFAGMDIVLREPFKSSFSGTSVRPSGRGADYIKREADREEEAEHKRKTGESD